jgi:AcrR family transcriptional regulator
MNLEEPAARRRRGAVLEDALLDATWQELCDVGYAAMTIDAVANRAKTSRPVIYRRWATKADLVLAAVDRALHREDIALPDTGSLRGDLIALMRLANERTAPSAVTLAYYLGPYFQETGTSPRDLREAILGHRATSAEAVVDRAAERGEIDADRLTPRLRTLAFDLYRHEALMTLAPVPDEVIEEILDEVFLPLVTMARLTRATPRKSAPPPLNKTDAPHRRRR